MIHAPWPRWLVAACTCGACTCGACTCGACTCGACTCGACTCGASTGGASADQSESTTGGGDRRPAKDGTRCRWCVARRTTRACHGTRRRGHQDSQVPRNRAAVRDLERPLVGHGTPPAPLRCEVAAVGYQPVSFTNTAPSGYGAIFGAPDSATRPTPTAISTARRMSPSRAPGDT